MGQDASVSRVRILGITAFKATAFKIHSPKLELGGRLMSSLSTALRHASDKAVEAAVSDAMKNGVKTSAHSLPKSVGGNEQQQAQTINEQKQQQNIVIEDAIRPIMRAQLAHDLAHAFISLLGLIIFIVIALRMYKANRAAKPGRPRTPLILASILASAFFSGLIMLGLDTFQPQIAKLFIGMLT